MTSRQPELQDAGDGSVKAVYQWKTFRFLLDDGRTLDVQAIRDDSDLRGAVLAHTKAERIQGVADIDAAAVEAPPVKRKRSTR